MVTELIPPQDDGTHSVGLALIRSALAGFEAGTVIGELLGVFTPSYERRLAKWRDDVALALMDLLRRTGQMERNWQRLQSDERFLSTLMTATRIAVATHAAEKLEALRNAVVNVAAGIDVDEIERQLFLRYVDELTELHLKILADPRSRFGVDQQLARQVQADLIGRGLKFERKGEQKIPIDSGPNSVRKGFITVPTGRRSLRSSEVSPMGKRFLKFLESPTPSKAAEVSTDSE